jgi:Mor family transcriptional regulator
MIDPDCINRLQRDLHSALDAVPETRDVTDHAERLARHIYPEITSGRYTTTLSPDELRKRRDAAVMADFTGRNREDVMRKHHISRRLFYSILSRYNSRNKIN